MSNTGAATVGPPGPGQRYAPFYAGYIARVTEEPVARLEPRGVRRAILTGVSDIQSRDPVRDREMDGECRRSSRGCGRS